MPTSVETFEHIISHQSTRELVPFLLGLSKPEVLQVREKALHFLKHGIPKARPQAARDTTIYPPLSAVAEAPQGPVLLPFQGGTTTVGSTKESSALFFLTGLATYSRKEAFGDGFHWWGSMAHDFFESRREEVWAVLAHARPAWLSDWLMGRNGNSLANYWLLRDLADAGFIEYRPQAFDFQFTMLAFRQQPAQLHQRLRGDETALKRDLPRQFEQDLSIARIDGRSYANFPKFSWLNIIVDLVATGHLERPAMLTQCLWALRRDFGRPALTWYVALFQALKPTLTERLALQNELMELLAHAQPLVVNHAIAQLGEVLPKPGFPLASLLLYAEGMLVRPDLKTSLRALLASLAKLPKQGAAQAPAVARLLASALAHPDGAVQERAAKGLADVLKEKLLSAPETAEAVALINQAADLLNATARKAMTPWLAAEEHEADSLAASWYVPADEFEPEISPATAIAPVADWHELLFLTGQVLKQNAPVALERWLDGLIRLRAQWPAGYAAQLEPYLFGLVSYLPPKSTLADVLASLANWPPAWSRGLVEGLFLAWYERFAVRRVSNVPLGRGPINRYGHGAFPSADDPLAFVNQQRLAFVEDLLTTKQQLPLLSTFTHRPHYIAPSQLIERLLCYQRAGAPPNLADLTVALARTAVAASSDATTARRHLPQLADAGLRDLLDWYFTPGPPPDGWPVSGTEGPLLPWPDTLAEALPGLWAVAIRTKYPSISLPWLDAVEELAKAELTPVMLQPYPSRIALGNTGFVLPENTVCGLPLYALHGAMRPRHEGPEGWDGCGNLQGNYANTHALIPQYPTPLYRHTLRCATSTNNLAGANHRLVTNALRTLLEAGPRLDQFATHLLAAGLIHEKPQCRRLAQEVLLRAIANGRLVPNQLGRVLGEQLATGCAPVQRFLDNMVPLRAIDAVTDDALRQLLDALLRELPTAAPPRNLRKLLQTYADLLARTRQQLPEPVRLQLTEWKKTASLKAVSAILLAA